MSIDKAFIMKKAGPLPVWAWMLISLGLLLIYTGYKRAKTGTTPTVATQGFNNMPPGTQYNPNDLTVIQEGYNPPAININNPAVSAPPVASREPQYSAFGTMGPNIYGMVNGVWKYLTPDAWAPYNNQPNVDRFVKLDQSQVSPSPTVSSPAPVFHPSAPTPRAVTVTPWNPSNPWSSTLSGIAQHYYNDASQYTRLAQANGIANPNLIYPGQQIVVP